MSLQQNKSFIISYIQRLILHLIFHLPLQLSQQPLFPVSNRYLVKFVSLSDYRKQLINFRIFFNFFHK